MLSSIIEKPQETNSIVVKMILDNIDDSLRVVKLESIPPSKFDTPRTLKFIGIFSSQFSFFLA